MTAKPAAVMETAIGTAIALVVYFVALGIVEAQSGYNGSAGYGVLWTTLFPIGIVLTGVAVMFGFRLGARK